MARPAQTTAEFVQALNDIAPHGPSTTFTVAPGRRFDKIIETSPVGIGGGGQRSVHAFVERATGHLIKAATWDAPQYDKDGLAVRYNLSTEEGFQEAVEAARTRGYGYLYKR